MDGGTRKVESVVDAGTGRSKWREFLQPDADRSLIIFTGAAAASYLLLIWYADTLPFTDFLNHLARSTIIGDIWFNGGKVWGDDYAFSPRLTPYILGDSSLAVLTRLFSPSVAGRIWLMTILILFPLAVAVYLRAFAYSRTAIYLASLLSLYLATDWFFLVGFSAYRLGIPLALFAIAAGKSFLNKPRFAAFILYGSLCVACYLTHLAAFLFASLALAVVGLLHALRHRSIATTVLLGIPLLVLALQQVTTDTALLASSAFVIRGSGYDKLMRLGSAAFRYNFRVDAALLILFGICLAALGTHALRQGFDFWEQTAISASCLTLYFLLPIALSGVYDVDNRAIPFVTLFAMCALLRGASATASRITIAAAALLVVVNFLYLAANIQTATRDLRAYRASMAAMPLSQRLLPVYTLTGQGRINHWLHAHAWATLDRRAVTPYLFSKTNGDPLSFFSQKHRLPAFDAHWYARNYDPPDWQTVAREYDFLLLTVPFDRNRIPVSGVWVANTSVAAMLCIGAQRECVMGTTFFHLQGDSGRLHRSEHQRPPGRLSATSRLSREGT